MTRAQVYAEDIANFIGEKLKNKDTDIAFGIHKHSIVSCEDLQCENCNLYEGCKSHIWTHAVQDYLDKEFLTDAEMGFLNHFKGTNYIKFVHNWALVSPTAENLQEVHALIDLHKSVKDIVIVTVPTALFTTMRNNDTVYRIKDLI